MSSRSSTLLDMEKNILFYLRTHYYCQYVYIVLDYLQKLLDGTRTNRAIYICVYDWNKPTCYIYTSYDLNQFVVLLRRASRLNDTNLVSNLQPNKKCK